MLPAIISDKLTLVVSPIKSLIDDTVLRCQNLGISACKFTREVPHEIQRMQVEHIEQYRIVVATPEMLEKGTLPHQAIPSVDLGRIVFDEEGRHILSHFQRDMPRPCKAVMPKTSTKCYSHCQTSANPPRYVWKAFGFLGICLL